MKKLNMFTRLPKEDQTLVLDLSAKLPYHAVVEQLAKPREEGGLSMTTSESSLCKFFTRHDREAVAIEGVGDLRVADDAGRDQMRTASMWSSRSFSVIGRYEYSKVRRIS